MRTSEELYHQVRWDPRYDPARFVLGVAQRGAAPKRVPLPMFAPGGVVPWHRVLYVEADGETVWDRAGGVDRLGETEAGRVRQPRLLRAPYFAARTSYVWHPARGAWGPGGRPDSARAASRLRVLTWNTLWDRYDSARIHTARRRPALLAALAAADADVIALQEVEAPLLSSLLREPWVRARYVLGTDPGGGEVDDNGLALLSRLPVREAAIYALGRHKAVLAVVVETSAGPLVVATTHLTSDHSTNGAQRREKEREKIAAWLAGLPGDAVLVGDFNDAREGDEGVGPRLGLRDAWVAARGAADRTPTFDPGANPLAALSSRSGEAGRLDRVLLRGPDLAVTAAELLGDEPTARGLYVSDHYGVAADLRVTPGACIGDDRPRRTPRTDHSAGDSAEEGRARSLARHVAEALGEGVVHVVGSRRMGCALPGADVDLVAVLPGTADARRLSSRLVSALPDATRIREVRGARVPGLRFHAEGLDVDLVLVGSGSLDPAEAVARRAELGEGAAVALSAVSDADAVRAEVDGAQDAFAGLARKVKAWARARGLDSAPFGGLPGLAWSILAARTVREAGNVDAGQLARRFFGDWAAWDWSEPVGGPAPAAAVAARPASSGAFRVHTPTHPVRSCTSQVGAGVRDLLVEELYRAWELLESGARAGTDPWPELLSPPPLHERHAAWAVLTVRADRPEGLDAALGAMRGRVRALLSALEEAGTVGVHAWPRPLDLGPASVRHLVGLGPEAPDAARFADLAAWWCRGLPGVELTWTESPGNAGHDSPLPWDTRGPSAVGRAWAEPTAWRLREP